MLKRVMLVVLAFIICFIFSSCDNNNDDVFHSVETEIVAGCYIEDLDDNMQSIYYYPDGDITKERIYIVHEWENIIKFASDGKNIVAFHCIYDQFENTEDDKFVIFNLSEEKEHAFDIQDDFIEFCKKENITLSDWKYGSGRSYEKIDLGNDWCVYNFDYPFNDMIMNGNKVVYEGYVSDIEYKENECVEFVFAVPFGEEKEIPSSNKNLNVSENIVGEYKFTLIGKDQVQYYEKLLLNTINGEITVISD